MLLVGASLMIRTLMSIQGENLAFHPERILTMRIPFSEQRYPDAARRNAFLQEVLRRIATVPGVVAVGINAGLPPIYSWSFPVMPPGSTQADTQPVLFQQTNESYARVMGLTQMQGRFLTEQEVNAGTHSAVVNQTFVRRYFPGGEPMGRIVRAPRMRTPPLNLTDDAFEIVGVVGDTVNRASTNEVLPEMYIPFTITGRADRILALANGRPEALDAAVKAQVYAVDPIQPVMEDADDGDGAGAECVLAPALQPAAVRRFRAAGAGAGALRDLRRDLACRGATNARDRNSDRAGGDAWRGRRDGAADRHEAGGDRHRCRTGGEPGDRETALRSRAKCLDIRCLFVRRCRGVAVRRRSVRELLAGAPGRASGSGYGVTRLTPHFPDASGNPTDRRTNPS